MQDHCERWPLYRGSTASYSESSVQRPPLRVVWNGRWSLYTVISWRVHFCKQLIQKKQPFLPPWNRKVQIRCKGRQPSGLGYPLKCQSDVYSGTHSGGNLGNSCKYRKMALSNVKAYISGTENITSMNRPPEVPVKPLILTTSNPKT